MRTNDIIVNVIFDAAKGECPVLSREATVGMPLGTLPRPSRSGYTFEGWTYNGSPVDESTVPQGDEDIRLVATWSRSKTGEKKSSMFKKQKVAVAVLIAVAVVLTAALILANQIVSIYGMEDSFVVNGEVQTEKYYVRKKGGVYGLYDRKGNAIPTNDDGRYMVYSGNQYTVDPETGECELYAVVATDGYEVLGFSDRVMLFPQITQKNTYSIEVKNQYGTYTFYRDEAGTVKIKGFEESMVAYDQTLFASLCVSCGYTLSMQRLDFSLPEDGETDRVPRLEDGSVDYDAYGLVDRKDKDGNVIYSPAVYTITAAQYDSKGNCTASDTSYTVKVGDAILSGAGYYIQMEGSEKVYIVSSDIGNTVLQPIEKLVTPMVVYPISVSTYTMINNFLLGTMNFTGAMEDVENKEEIDLDPIVSFTFKDLESRQNSIYTSRPYVCFTDMMKGYELNSDNVSEALMKMYEMEFVNCVKLGLTKEVLKEYGLDGDVHYLYYESPVTDDSNNIDGYIGNTLLISQRTKDGTYYIASFLTEMIVEVDEYYLTFLGWEQSDWYDQYFFQHNIAYVTNMSFQVGNERYEFRLDNSASYMYYEASDGSMKQIDLKTGKLETSGGKTVYIDKAGTRYNVRALDFGKGSYKLRVYDSAGELEAEAPYTDFVLATDRNSQTTLKLGSDEYEMTAVVNGKVTAIRSYRVVYVDGSGEEYEVVGTYTASDSKSYKDFYRLPYWTEVYDETEKEYKWTRTEPVPGSVILRDKNEKEYTMSVGSANLQVYCDRYTENAEGKLDYVINYVDSSSGIDKNKQLTAVDNFRKLYSLLMWYSIEGDLKDSVFEKNMGMSVKEYLAAHGNEVDAMFTYRVQDMASIMNLTTGLNEDEDLAHEVREWEKNNEMEVVVRLYRYSDTKSLLTLEVVELYDKDGNPIENPMPDPTKAQGSFYVLTEYADTLIEAAHRLVNGERVEQ